MWGHTGRLLRGGEPHKEEKEKKIELHDVAVEKGAFL